MKMILAATDFSRPAALAVRRAGQLARAAEARLELIHVLPPEPIPTSWTAVRDAFGLDPARVKDDAMTRLTRAAGRIDAQPALPVELHLAQGRAHAEIAARAGVIGADLLVVGAHGEHFVSMSSSARPHSACNGSRRCRCSSSGRRRSMATSRC